MLRHAQSSHDLHYPRLSRKYVVIRTIFGLVFVALSTIELVLHVKSLQLLTYSNFYKGLIDSLVDCRFVC